MEKLTKVKDELTIEVDSLAIQLQQERSKVSALTNESKKTAVNIKYQFSFRSIIILLNILKVGRKWTPAIKWFILQPSWKTFVLSSWVFVYICYLIIFFNVGVNKSMIAYDFFPKFRILSNLIPSVDPIWRLLPQLRFISNEQFLRHPEDVLKKKKSYVIIFKCLSTLIKRQVEIKSTVYVAFYVFSHILSPLIRLQQAMG